MTRKDYQPDSLFRKLLNTSGGRSKGDPPPHTFEHWTREGTFRLSPTYPAGMLQCALHLGDRFIGTFENPEHAAHSLAAGELDEELGFSVAKSGLPKDLADWGQA